LTVFTASPLPILIKIFEQYKIRLRRRSSLFGGNTKSKTSILITTQNNTRDTLEIWAGRGASVVVSPTLSVGAVKDVENMLANLAASTQSNTDSVTMVGGR
jgi:hypothetical protein